MPIDETDAEALLGSDLWYLATSRGAPLIGVRILSRSPRATRGAFRLTFADGVVVKARRCEKSAQAERITQLTSYLDPLCFPRVDRWHGCALFEEWIEGRPLSREADHAVFQKCGAILAGVHSVCLPEHLRLAALSAIEASSAHLLEGLERLVQLKALAADDAAAASDLAMSRIPRHFVPTLVHGDFCGENMVVDATGRVLVIDNETVLVHTPEYDLARTWYRWPMSGPQWAAYERGYGDSPAIRRFRTHGDFWTILVLVESALFRLRTEAAAPEIPFRRLQSLLRERRASAARDADPRGRREAHTEGAGIERGGRRVGKTR